MHTKFDRIGLVGRSQQEGLTDVLDELVHLLQGLGKDLVLESRLAELVADQSIPRASLDEIGRASCRERV